MFTLPDRCAIEPRAMNRRGDNAIASLPAASAFSSLRARRRAHFRLARTLVVSASLLTGITVCGRGLAQSPESSGSAEDEIIGGTAVATCNWSATVGIGGWGNCSGTLIHPKIVTTAAHCLSGATTTTVLFGEKSGTGFSLKATKCQAGAPDANHYNTEADWAYCVLPDDDRVKKLPYIPPLAGCELKKFFKVGATLRLVGFGATQGPSSGGGTKREVDVPLNFLGLQNKPTERVFNVGNASKSACHGDSGGPAFLHLVDGANDWGWRTVGSTSGPGPEDPQSSCTGSGYYVNIEMHIAAIEKNEQIDVTPCTDAQGNWAPGPDCKNFPVGPDKAGGTWPACAMGAQTTLPIDSCGAGPSDAGGGGGAGGGDGGAGAAGSGGRAGSAGAAGSGATAGAGGIGGSGATGGAAGTGGVAGASGAAGSGGLGGSGGAAGTGGAAGAGTGARAGAAGSGGSAGNGGFGGSGQGGVGADASPPTGGSSGRSTGGAGGVRIDAGNGAEWPHPRQDPGCGCRSVAQGKPLPFGGWLALTAALAARISGGSRRRRQIVGGAKSKLRTDR